MTDNRLRYEPANFITGVNVSPEDLDTLNRAGLPKRFIQGDTTLEAPVGVDVPGRGYMIRFTDGRGGGVYFDPLTGEVLFIGDWPGQEPYLVNSSLEQFTRTERALIDAFPFYDDLTRDLNEVDVDTLAAMYEESAARLAKLIREIDPLVLTPDSFWEEFLLDVMHGEYATREILRSWDSDLGV